MSEKLQLLHDSDVGRALERADVEVFRYTLNKPGLYLVVFLSFILYALAGLTFWETQLVGIGWNALFFGLLAAGTGLAIWTLYWHAFVTTNLVGVSPRKLYVGGKDRLWGIDWDLLDPAAMGFGDMELSRMKGKLEMHVGGQKIDLHLFGPFAYVEDIQGFMFRVLQHLQPEEGAEAVEDEEAVEVD